MAAWQKYGAIKVQLDGHSFASKLEAALYSQLCIQLRAGEFIKIQCQDHVYLTRARIDYIADFKTIDKDGKESWHEAKGYSTPVWGIKKRLWKSYGPGVLFIYKGSYTRLVLDETIIPKGREGGSFSNED